MKKFSKVSIIFLFLFLIFTPLLYANTINITEVLWQEDPLLDPLSLSATVDFADGIAGDDRFTIQLSNTTGPTLTSDFPATVMLTGLGFNLNGYGIEGGLVYSTNLMGSNADPSHYWGYDNNISNGYFKQGEVTTKLVDSVVSTMTAAADVRFDGTTNGNPIAGPNWGVLGPGTFTGAYPYFEGSIFIEIDLDGNISDWNTFISDVNSNDVVVAFGSPTAPIPEPATMLLFGTGLIGLAGVRRKKMKK